MALANFPMVQRYITMLILGVGSLQILWKIYKYTIDLNASMQKWKMLEKWTKTSPNDVVVLHVFPPGRSIANPSPFAIKLETYLKMANIPYMIDTQSPKGEKDKTPWITLNSENHTDSELIIDFLEKKFNVVFGEYSKHERAVGTMARILMDEHFYWGLIHWRYIFSGGNHLHNLFPFYSPKELEKMRRVFKSKYTTYTWYQGIGRHSDQDIINIMCQDLQALSLVIGDKKFLLGDEPAREDCAVFGMLSQAVWAETDSPYQKLIAEDLKNLQEYCVRMKERFWPDWDHVLAK